MEIIDKAAAIIGCVILAVIAAIPLTILWAMIVWGLKDLFRKEKKR